MLIPFSFDTKHKEVNSTFLKQSHSSIDWRINFIDNSTESTPIHSTKQSMAITDCKIVDNYIIITISIHLIRLNHYQYLLLLKNLIFDLRHATELIVEFLFFHVRFKFIEIYGRSYTINCISCVCLLIYFYHQLRYFHVDDNISYVYF